jgi:hypothetical protein
MVRVTVTLKRFSAGLANAQALLRWFAPLFVHLPHAAQVVTLALLLRFMRRERWVFRYAVCHPCRAAARRAH